jgi:hypothetical protein
MPYLFESFFSFEIVLAGHDLNLVRGLADATVSGGHHDILLIK